VVLQELAEVAALGVLAHHADGLAGEADAQDPDQIRIAQARQDSGLVFKVGSKIELNLL
jgi:hypothetical protein